MFEKGTGGQAASGTLGAIRLWSSYTAALLLIMILPMTAKSDDAPWQAAAGPLKTRWTLDVSPQRVHAEYPRPQLVRPGWQNLNGLWQYAIRPRGASRPESFDGEILVPFPVESALSGVMKPVGESNRLWYRRQFNAPKLESDGRLLLHFGAVDWQCEVWVNGSQVGVHRGGYDPFTLDITDALVAGDGQELVVAVWDPTDQGFQSRGKQVQKPRSIWYTAVTGIWQTVWLEGVPKASIESLAIVPDVDNAQLRLSVTVRGASDAARVRAVATDGQQQIAAVEGAPADELLLKISRPKLWSPDTPFLYGLQVRLEDPPSVTSDAVESYFGMRKITVGKGDDGNLRLLLNDKPLFQLGPLDQGWWPDGLYTAPTDEALRYDLEVTKQLGFNLVRKHVKVEPSRWYYHCDRLGLLVWQDMPNGDKHARWNARGKFDGGQIERSAESAEQFRRELRAVIDARRNHPSIVMWVPFNEGWGQFDTVAIADWIKQHDPTRLVNAASGGNDFPVGDVKDIHRYPGPGIPEMEAQRAAVLGEFGGLGLPLTAHTWQSEKNWGYRSFKTRDELVAAYLAVFDKLRPLVDRGLAAAVYTQTTDVEIEINGLMTYDREVLKLDDNRVRAVNRAITQTSN